jgi:hypothetical protein
MKNALWRNSALLSGNLSSDSFCLHLPSAQNVLAARLGEVQVLRPGKIYASFYRPPLARGIVSPLIPTLPAKFSYAFSTVCSLRRIGFPRSRASLWAGQESAAGTSSPGIAATASEILGYWNRSAKVGGGCIEISSHSSEVEAK